MLFTLSLQRGDLRRQFARRFSKLFLRRFSGSAQIRILFPQSVNRTLCFILITFFSDDVLLLRRFFIRAIVILRRRDRLSAGGT